MKIGMLMFRHPPGRTSPIMPEVARLLQGWGAAVDVIYPEETVSRIGRVRVEHDLYVLKSGTELALSLAGALHGLGAKVLNPFPVAAAVRDKIAGSGVLAAAGIPVPETYVASQPRQLEGLLEAGPLIVKPYRGSEGRGIQVVREAGQLDGVSGGGGPVFAQRYHKPDGFDRKIYCVGGQLFGVIRAWPVRTYKDKIGVPFTLTPELRDIALRCGRAFGIDLYGLDIIESGGQPYVVDFSSFPGFKGVPNAALRLADHIYAAAERALQGESPASSPREVAA